MIWLFWICAAFLGYTFIVYPLLVWVASAIRALPARRATIVPRVTLILSVYNEREIIAGKLKNTLALTYPRDKFQVIVCSDASTDGTDDIVASYGGAGIELIRVTERRGKNHALMVAKEASMGEILVFTDAGIQLACDAIETIVANFADSTVGVVSSEDQIIGRGVGTGEGAYIDFEMKLRRRESLLNSVVGASGSFFAARAEVCRKWHPDQTSDFFVPLHAVEMGLRVVVDPLSIGYYDTARSGKAEFQRKVRTIVNGLTVFFTHTALLNPLRYPIFSWQMVSHKLFRWLLPVGFLLLLLSNLFLWNAGWFYRFSLLGQLLVYVTGATGLLIRSLAGFWPARIASFFILGNVATLMAWVRFLRGEKFERWEPTRRNEHTSTAGVR
ncbi:MAG: glycosyltransferase [Terriglobia bacterium]|nr:glycosyltransferase [Terriglobia bacterium]